MKSNIAQNIISLTQSLQQEKPSENHPHIWSCKFNSLSDILEGLTILQFIFVCLACSCTLLHAAY